jgi:hypothetical protein
MNACLEQGFVGVDVAHATQETLVHEQRFEPCVAFF